MKSKIKERDAANFKYHINDFKKLLKVRHDGTHL